jgi:type II secretory pathway pseudopilin PulG
MFKKGAMFGLDARIALAIFGALSVISGAALYSAIQDAKATAIVTELTEVAKAYEAYLLDTGQEIPRRSSDSSNWKFYSFDTNNLVVNRTNVANWKGPYLPYEENVGIEFLSHPSYGNILMEMMNDNDWSATAWEACDTAGEKCYITVSLDEMGDASLVARIDEKVDGGDGAGAGKFRWITSDLNARWTLFVRPIQNPKD